MENREHYKQQAFDTTSKTINEMQVVLEALQHLLIGINKEDLGKIKAAWDMVSDHIGGGQYDKHIQFEVPQVWEFENELEAEAEEAETVAV